MTKKSYYPNPEQNFDFAKTEDEILKFWQENKIFEKSIENRDFTGLDDDEDFTSPANCCGDPNHNHHAPNEFVFYDGPPFANGLPHYGHLLTGYIKDIFARYQTMKGKKVERRFGWDTHGLPVEMEVEKELGVSGQIAIKEYGIEKFNEACKKSVMKYAGEWKDYVTRQGRWVNFDGGYKTMDINYMESVIWAFKQLYDKGLVYEDYKVVPYSWACQTPLSNFETRMDNSYRRKESKAVTVKFELEKNSQFLKEFKFKQAYLLAWTTTAWTLPSNLALAIGRNIEYDVLFNSSNETIYILAQSCVSKYEKELSEFKAIKKIKGQELLNLKYKPLFPYFINHEKIKNNPKAFTILHGDFVSTEDGTGVVHMAPGFGEDDQLLCKENGIPTICPVDEGGKFTSEIFDIEYEINTPHLSPSHKGRGLESPSPLVGEGRGEGYKDLTDLTKELRQTQTKAESKLWDILKNRQIDNLKFRRQEQIGNYIADFVCFEKKIIIELDGDHHGYDDVSAKDLKRTEFLEKEGFKVLRFWNNEVLGNIEGVYEEVMKQANTTHKIINTPHKIINTPHPNPLPQGEREILSLKGRQVLGFNSQLQYEKENDPNIDIINYLKSKNLLLKQEQYFHNYPHCWRTDTPLIYRALPSWYVKVTAFKDRMVEINSGKVFNIETKRLIGKFADEKYLGELTALYSDPEVRKYFYFLPDPILDEKLTLKEIENYKRQQENHGLPRFVFFEKDSGKFVGCCGLSFYDPNNENFKTGKIELSRIIAKEFWNKGYGAEIAQELIDLAFIKFNVDAVCAANMGDNLSSQKSKEKIGFKLINKSNYYPKVISKNHEYWYYEISKSDWKRPEKIKSSYLNQGINWIPEHIRDGQFGKWLEGARDWSITRNRFWGCPVPVWVSDNPQFPRIDVYGSLQEIEKDFGVRPDNLHRPFIDELKRPNPNDPSGKSKMVRVPDVLDCWFESGSMPYAQAHYPFENKEWFENNFPADFITEYVAQTRGWFYTLVVLSTALFDKAPFKNVICHGTILDEQSQKLSKRLKNYADPLEIFSTYGSDAMRFYMVSQPVMKGQELRIDKEGKAIKDTSRLSIRPLINAYNFFCLYANSDGIEASRINDSDNLNNIMDRYILAKLKIAVNAIDKAMQNYDTPSATEHFSAFFEALNNWYIRRNRHRFWKSEIDTDKMQAYNTLYTALLTICEAAAPLLPFTTEKVWRDLHNVKE